VKPGIGSRRNLDLAVANYYSNNVSLLLGNGDGTFQAAANFDVGTRRPSSVAVGDFNDDGARSTWPWPTGVPPASRS